MTEIEVEFNDTWSVEQRKAAINQALEEHSSFEIKDILIVAEADGEETHCNFGFTQMVSASSARIQIIKKQMSIQQL